jgi:hypothetical protein
MTNPISRKADGCDSWENLRNLLNRNEPIRHQLGEKPREINAALGTHAPQQRGFRLGSNVGDGLRENPQAHHGVSDHQHDQRSLAPQRLSPVREQPQRLSMSEIDSDDMAANDDDDRDVPHDARRHDAGVD